jgi:hypothetical protein
MKPYTNLMVKRIAVAVASILMIGTMLSGCKTGEQLLYPDANTQQNSR